MANKKKKATDYHNPGKRPWIAMGGLMAVIIVMVVAMGVVWEYAVPAPQVVDVEELELRAMDMGGAGGPSGGGVQPGAPPGGQPGAPPGGQSGEPPDGGGGGTSTKPVDGPVIETLLGDELKIFDVVGNYLTADVAPPMDDPSMMDNGAATGPPGGPGGMGGGGGPGGGGNEPTDSGSSPQAYLKAKNGEKPELFTGRITENHPNGKRKWEVTVKEGHAHGLVLRWDDEGRVVAKMQYAEGMLVGMTSLIQHDVTRDEVFKVMYADAPSEFTDPLKDVITQEEGALKSWIINGEDKKFPKSIQVYFAGQLLLWAEWDNDDGEWKRFTILLPWHYEEKLAEAAKGEEELPDDEREKEFVKVEKPGIYSLKRENYTALGEPKKEEDDANTGPAPPDDPNAQPPGGGSAPPGAAPR
ncbi:MAG: hypothetical protein CL483_00520 [Acidobacteria bacterium]|nr:hypothetical protein [Acidobacteriota bacterium]